MKGALFLVSLMLCLSLVGQITEDFSDGDFTSNPTWSGDDIEFQVNAGELQLFDDKTDDSHLMTASTIVNDGVWEFLFRWEGFSSTGLSSSNEVFFYIMADQNLAPESNNIAGYLVRIGNTSDEISFYRQDTDLSSLSELIDGNSNGFGGVTASASGSVRVRVSRDALGNWTLEADVTGGTSFSEVGTVMDVTHTTTAFTGLFIDYSSGNADGYFFDDIQVSSSAGPDTDPPLIQSVTAISATQVDVQFNENVDETTSQNAGNYSLGDDVNISSAVRDGTDNSLVHLTTSVLTNGTSYTLVIENVEDENGNVIVPDSEETFQYLVFEEAVEFDVVINEFMPDPNPVVTSLPDAEYVELYNRSNKYFNLENWMLDGQSLPAFTLAPDTYVLVVEDDDIGLFGAFTDVLPITTLSLNNSSVDNIVLLDDNATNIHSITFEGSTGGISTELINPNGPDYSENNYGVSTDPDGGTPGEQNSIFDDTPDTTSPSILSINVISNTELDVTFDEVLEEVSAETTGNYSIDGGISIVSAMRDDADNEIVHLVVGPLVSGEIRTLTVSGVQDLSGNVASDTEQFEYIETEEAVVGDIVINEFLSNPINNNDDFIELFNSSDKFINMAGWNVSDETSTSEELPSFILRPGAYLIIYDEDATIDYSAFENSLSIASLTLNNSNDQVEITSGTDVQIAFLAYEEEQEDGVSLELVNPDDPCLSIASYLPSQAASGSTPGTQNSVFDDSPDTMEPTIQSFNFGTTLTINFSEVMDASSLTSGTYSVSNGITVNQVVVIGEFPTSIEVSFNETIDPGVLYEFTISNVTDCSGNVLAETRITFGIGRSPMFNELIITEVMFDPDPQIELPNQEYIELYNAAAEILTTENISLTDASATVMLPSRTLNPGEYYVLTKTSAVSEFSGNVIGVPGFPSLNNSGEQLILTSNDALIFSLTYDPDWHDEDKSEGGYSLEMRDVTNPCLEDGNNWSSSQSANGGTPGSSNSESEIIPDNFGPRAILATAILSDSVRLDFSEKIDPTTVSLANISITPTIEIDQMYFNVSHPSSMFITLASALQESVPYTIDVENIADCTGNVIQDGSVVFALPVQASENEIKLSEVLFNPKTNGVDFVEIYNDSEEYISLRNWKLGNLDDEGEVNDIDVITEGELVIAPQQFLVFTTDGNILLTNYPKAQASNFFEVGSMPSYPNDEGTVLLINQSEEVVESFRYSEDFHYNLLESADGVSLERVSYNEATSNGNNWRSASSTEGFATPGYANSQALSGDVPSGTVTASPEVFIPGNVGSGRDFTTINYQLDQPGQFANVNIYDQTGRLVKNLAQGVLLSTSGFLRWDGDTNDGGMARMGYHLIIFEIYDSSGNSEIIKETVVVGRDF